MTESQPDLGRKRLQYDTPQQEAYLNLWRTYDRLRVLEDKLFLEHGLTAQQYNALRLLAARGLEGMATLEVAKRLVSRSPDITRLISPLVEMGWVTRTRPEENRRIVRLSITEAGQHLLDQLENPVTECGTEQLGHLNAGELADLTKLLQKARGPHEDPQSAWSLEESLFGWSMVSKWPAS